MPTLEELLNSKDQSLGSFSSSEDESVVDESSLTPEELSAATALGISTKRLSKKAYGELKKKAEGIVKQSSIKPEKTIKELAESLVKKGGKSAEASAKQFVKAQPSLGFPTKDVAEAVGDSIPSDVLKPATQTPLAKSPLLSRIAAMASSPAGKLALKGLGLAGVVSGLHGTLSEDQDEPVGAQLSAKKLAPGHTVTSSVGEPGDATQKYPSKQRTSSAYDSLDQIKKDVRSQPMVPKYADAYTEMLNQRSKFLENLDTEQVWQGNTSRPLTDEEKEERYARYEAGLLGEENLAKRASSMVEQKETQQKELEDQLAQINSEINRSTNPFAVERLNKEKNSILAALSNLTSSGSEEPSKTPTSLTQEPSEFLRELMSQPAAQMPQQPAVEQPQSSEAESLKPTKRTISAGEPSAIDVQKRDREESLSKIIGAEAARQVAEQESLLARFKQAQQQENLAQLGISLGQAGEKFGSSLAMVKPGDQSFYDQQRKLASGFAEKVKDEEAIRQEAEKNDPNSPLSKQYQELIKSMGIPIKGNESASTLIKALPFIQQYQSQKENRQARLLQAQIQREQIAAGKQILADERVNKGFVDMTKRIEGDIASARSAFGRSALVIRAAGAIERLASKFNPNDLSYTEIQEIAKSLDGMLAQGAPTISGTQKLVPESLIGDWKKIQSYILNIPKGAEQGKFVKRLLATIGREKEYAKEQVLKTQTELLSGYEHLKNADPDRWGRTLKAFGIPTEGSLEQQLDSSKEKKETVRLPKKQTGSAGKTIVSKDGKRYKINDDETTATEI